MKSYLLLSSVSDSNSACVFIGKKLVILARFVLVVSLAVFFSLLIIGKLMNYGEGSSGVPFGFGIIFWLFFELIGSIFIEIGKFLRRNDTHTTNDFQDSSELTSSTSPRSHALGVFVGKFFRKMASLLRTTK